MPDSVVVLTAKTVSLAESKAARMLREGETTSKVGEVPALIGATRAKASSEPSMNTSPPKSVAEVTPCEARTRWCSPLTVGLLEELLHPFKLKLAQTPSSRKAIALFRVVKLRAPKNMKKEDLSRNRGL